MQKNSLRGEALTLVVVLVAAAGALIFSGRLHLPAFLVKKPKTEQLSQAQVELADARRRQAEAEARLNSVLEERAAITNEQLDYGQQMSTGTTLALGRVPVEHQTPEVKLATELSLRANAALDAARGKLSPALQAEMEKLISHALSAVQAERDAFKAALIVKDAVLTTTIAEKQQLEAKIPALEKERDVAVAKTEVVAAKTEVLVKQVADYADGKAEKEREAGSWKSYFWLVVRVGTGLFILYVVGGWVLPSLAQEYPGSRYERWNKAVKSLTTAHL